MTWEPSLGNEHLKKQFNLSFFNSRSDKEQGVVEKYEGDKKILSNGNKLGET